MLFQADPNFKEEYAGLDGFDDGTIESSLEYRDSSSWQMKSWVVGVVHRGHARAYDWNDLLRTRALLDTLGGDTIMITASKSGFEVNKGSGQLTHMDYPFHLDGIDTMRFEVQLMKIPAYQEFWHSWRTFHPNTTRYEPR